MSKSLHVSAEPIISIGAYVSDKLKASTELSLAGDSFISTQNHILRSLPTDIFFRLLPNLQLVNWRFGQTVYLAEDPIKYVYFPESAVVSVIAATAQGESAEVGMIGSEGIIGIDALLGAEKVLNEHLVSIAGSAFRIKLSVVRDEFRRERAIQSAVFNCIRLLILQISQTALCNRLHSLEERFARWLLLCDDRAPGNELKLTHEFLAAMLAVNRPTISVAASLMRSSGLIKYHRGLITILDRQKLENFACACYRKVKDEYDRF